MLPKADSLGKDLVLQDWRRERGELFQAVAMEKHVMSLMLVLIVMVAAFNILSALAPRYARLVLADDMNLRAVRQVDNQVRLQRGVMC